MSQNTDRTWIDNYFSLKFGLDANEDTQKKADDLKSQEFKNIGHLYRYRNLKEIERLTENDKNGISPLIYLSQPFDFNDPFDTWIPVIIKRKEHPTRKYCVSKLQEFLIQPNITAISQWEECLNDCIDTLNIEDWAEWIQSYLDVENKYLPLDTDIMRKKGIINLVNGMSKIMQLHQEFCHNAQKSYGIVCFSEIPDSILMWSHYSENHKGICFEYDINAFSKMSHLDIVKDGLFPVRYQNDLSDLADLHMKYFNEELTKKQESSMVIKTSISKALVWSYEREWRLIIHLTDNVLNDDRLKSLIPCGVYLGAKISPNDEKVVTEIALKYNMRIFKMRMADEKYELIADRIP